MKAKKGDARSGVLVPTGFGTTPEVLRLLSIPDERSSQHIMDVLAKAGVPHLTAPGKGKKRVLAHLWPLDLVKEKEETIKRLLEPAPSAPKSVKADGRLQQQVKELWNVIHSMQDSIKYIREDIDLLFSDKPRRPAEQSDQKEGGKDGEAKG
jgi:hypothetical protein